MRLGAGGIVLGLGFVAALAGCGGGEVDRGPAEAEASTIVGDWFVCEEAACANLDGNGWRFQSDGTAQRLDGSDGPAAEPVCADFDDERGPYQYENGMLTLLNVSVRAELSQDILTLHDVPAPTSTDPMAIQETVRMLRVETTISTMCPGDPPPMP